MHYYQFNIGDYAKATRHLSNLEDLVYRRLIELYYDTEEPLITDIKKLSRLINMRENEEEIRTVLDDFFVETEGGYSQSRIENEIASYKAKAESARVNGKKGGRPKKAKANPTETEGKAKKTQSVNLENQTETEGKAKKSESKANQEPRTINQEPLTKNQLSNTSAKANNDILEVFNYWKEVMKKNNSSILNAKRTKALKDRFKEGYTVDQIKMAIVGCSMTPHNMGQNNNGKKYDDLELICRDGVQVERFANNAQQQAPERYGHHVSKTLDALNNMEWDDD